MYTYRYRYRYSTYSSSTRLMTALTHSLLFWQFRVCVLLRNGFALIVCPSPGLPASTVLQIHREFQYGILFSMIHTCTGIAKPGSDFLYLIQYGYIRVLSYSVCDPGLPVLHTIQSYTVHLPRSCMVWYKYEYSCSKLEFTLRGLTQEGA